MKNVIFVLMLLAAAVLLFVFGPPVFGADEKPKTIDFTQVLIGVDGKALFNPETKVTLTLGEVAITALETMNQEDRDMPGAKKFQMDELARKIHGNKAAVLPVEDITLIKERIGKAYGPMVVGPAWRLLDPATEQKK
jgi:hypothetical protein